MKKVLEHAEEVLVVEELDPVVEYQLKSIANDIGTSAKIRGKELIPESNELSLEAIFPGVARFLGLNAQPPWRPGKQITTNPPIPPRPPVLCAGCPHRMTYYIVKVAANRAGLKQPIYTGDIGCYTLGFTKPFETQMTCFEMGGSLGIAHGFAITLNNPIIGVIGDSTFFHTGIPPAINSVYNKKNVIPLVLDNLTTAMTGHQPHPGTGVTAIGEQSNRILPESVLRAIGYKTYIINPLDVKGSIEALRSAFEEHKKGERIAIVSRMRCALEVLRDARREKVVLPVYKIDEDKCTGCMACVNLAACPAIIVPAGSKKPVIIGELCAGCGLCASICPYKAISIANKPTEGWERLWG